MGEDCTDNPPKTLCNNKRCGKKHPKNPKKLICRNCLFRAQQESDLDDEDDEQYAIEHEDDNMYIEKVGAAVFNKHNGNVEYTDGFLNILSKGSSCLKVGYMAMFDVYESCVGVKRLEGRQVAEGEIDCTQYQRVETIVEDTGRGKYLLKRKKQAPISIKDVEIGYVCTTIDDRRVLKWTAP